MQKTLREKAWRLPFFAFFALKNRPCAKGHFTNKQTNKLYTCSMESLSGFSTLLIMTLFIATFLIGAYFWVEGKRKFKIWQKERKLTKLLGARALEQVLAESPYDFGHFQGEDGYRIYDKRVQDGFVGFAATPLDAHLWIVGKSLTEQK